MVFMLGCSQSSNRRALEGTVTFDGKALEEGAIVFTPKSGTQGPVAGGDISRGHFSIPPSGGPFSGEFRVEITATRKTGRKITDPRNGQLYDEKEQFIPPRYNRQSELTAKVNEQEASNFEFALLKQ